MEVLKQISPVQVACAPNASPSKYRPSSRARIALLIEGLRYVPLASRASRNSARANDHWKAGPKKADASLFGTPEMPSPPDRGENYGYRVAGTAYASMDDA